MKHQLLRGKSIDLSFINVTNRGPTLVYRLIRTNIDT